MKYHLYMDESGEFEGKVKSLGGQGHPSLLMGLMIPEAVKEEFSQQFLEICQSFGLQKKFIHSTDLNKKSWFRKFAESVVDLFLNNDAIVSFSLTHEEDIYSQMDASIRESYAANRYLNMVQATFEHLMFLHPAFFGRTITCDFHPNSRVAVLKTGHPDIENFSRIGFVAKETDRREQLLFVWNSDILRSYLHRLALEYFPWQSLTGKRRWDTIETIVAKYSQDPLVAVVDILAWILRAATYQDLAEKVRRKLDVDLVYGFEQQTYRRLVRLYLGGHLTEFIPAALQARGAFKAPYYQRATDLLLEKSLHDVNMDKVEDLLAIERRVVEALADSRGNWSFVEDLVRTLLRAADNLPGEIRRRDEVRAMVLRLRNQQLRIHNHRGESGRAFAVYQQIEQEQMAPAGIEDYREQIALKNRLAVTASNLFAFEAGNALIADHLKILEEALALMRERSDCALQDPLLGKLKGTYAQNLAFLAPRRPDLLPRAEALFAEAAASFSRSGDILRHRINLVDLYLDHGRLDDAGIMLQEIHQDPGVAPFFREPGAATARSMQFVLRTTLKHALATDGHAARFLTLYSPQNLQDWFGEAVREHPFEFIYAYLGRMAHQQGQAELAADCFRRALDIPAGPTDLRRPTILAIHAQIQTWRALTLAEEDPAAARRLMGEVLSRLAQLSEDIDLRFMLALPADGEPEGWLAPGWQALSGVDWNKEFYPAACETFLRCFTFNYR